MEIKTLSCCALQEIANIGYMGYPPSRKSANTRGESLLEEFCKLNWGSGGGRVKYHSTTAAPKTLYNFYIFSYPVRSLDDSMNTGKVFADAIKHFGLGDVWESPATVNEAFHADHKNQMWVWMPDSKKLYAWYTARVKKSKDQD